jgi:hypothetical protein
VDETFGQHASETWSLTMQQPTCQVLGPALQGFSAAFARALA